MLTIIIVHLIIIVNMVAEDLGIFFALEIDLIFLLITCTAKKAKKITATPGRTVLNK